MNLGNESISHQKGKKDRLFPYCGRGGLTQKSLIHSDCRKTLRTPEWVHPPGTGVWIRTLYLSHNLLLQAMRITVLKRDRPISLGNFPSHVSGARLCSIGERRAKKGGQPYYRTFWAPSIVLKLPSGTGCLSSLLDWNTRSSDSGQHHSYGDHRTTPERKKKACRSRNGTITEPLAGEVEVALPCPWGKLDHLAVGSCTRFVSRFRGKSEYGIVLLEARG